MAEEKSNSKQDELKGVVDVQVSVVGVNGDSTKAENPKKVWFKLFVRVFLSVVLLFFAIFFTWYAVFLGTHNYYSVKGVSMIPTLNREIPESEFDDPSGVSYDCVYVDKQNPPKIFDIIVINTNQTIVENGKKTNKTLIKRLMATAGDYITVAKTVDENGNERLNFFRIPKNELPDEDSEEFEQFEIVDEMWKKDENGEDGYQIYKPDSIWTHELLFSPSPTKTLSVEVNGQTFEHEYDYNFCSIYFQEFSQEKVKSGDFKISKSGLVYVKVPEGKFFYMGDNRAHSSDAREDGFRNFSDIVGPVEIVIDNNGLFARIGTFMNYFFQEVEKFFAI